MLEVRHKGHSLEALRMGSGRLGCLKKRPVSNMLVRRVAPVTEGKNTFLLSREQGRAVALPAVIFLLTQKTHGAVFGWLLK
jgi:hypothetical protein